MILIFYDGPSKDLPKIRNLWNKRKWSNFGYIVDNSQGYSRMMKRFDCFQDAPLSNKHRTVITNCITLLSRLKPNEDVPYYDIYFYKRGNFIKLHDIYPNIRISQNIEKMYRANVFAADIEKAAQCKGVYKALPEFEGEYL